MKKLLTLIILLCSVAPFMEVKGQNDSTLTVTLDQCIEMALNNNQKAVAARNNIESSVLLSKEAFTKYFPEIGGTTVAFWANHNTLQYDLDILGNKFPLGIIKNGYTAAIQAMQPIFMGGRIANGNQLAHIGEEVARLREKQTQNELRVTTETFYWKLVSLEATRGTLCSAVTMLDTLQYTVKAAVDAGIVNRNDLLKVELKRNSYASDLVDLDNGIKLVKMLLGQYIGAGIDGNIEIVYNVPEEVPVFPMELYMDSEDAVLLTPDYNLLNKNVEAKKLEKKIELGKNLPTVAFGAGWYFHNLLKQGHNFGALQLGVAVPLSGWWGGSYSLKRKSIEVINAENEKDDLTQKLQLQMQDKWNNLTSAYRKMQIESEGIAQSKENLRITRLYYEAGMNTIADLLEAETEYTQAQGRYIAAFGNFCTARGEYLVATGRH